MANNVAENFPDDLGIPRTKIILLPKVSQSDCGQYLFKFEGGIGYLTKLTPSGKLPVATDQLTGPTEPTASISFE